MRFIRFSDDDIAPPPAAVDALTVFYANAEISQIELGPLHTGHDSIGHFGFFQPVRHNLWHHANPTRKHNDR